MAPFPPRALPHAPTPPNLVQPPWPRLRARLAAGRRRAPLL